MHGCVKGCEQACAGVRVLACGCLRTLRMKGMFVLTPRMRVSMSARSSFSAADLKSSAEPVTCTARCEDGGQGEGEGEGEGEGLGSPASRGCARVEGVCARATRAGKRTEG